MHAAGRSQFTLMTFSNFGFAADKGLFWGEQLCEKESFDAIGFVAKRNNWFPSVSMAQAAPIVLANQTQPSVIYGHSQGGYAALKYSKQLNARAVLSCAPQFSINPAIVEKEIRFEKNFDATLHQDMEIKAEDLEGRIIIIYDPQEYLDDYHTQKILSAAGGSSLELLKIHYMGHEVTGILIDREFFLNLVGISQGRESLHDLFKAARGLKKKTTGYGIVLAEHLLKKKKPMTANAVLDRAAEQTGGYIHSKYQAKYARLRTNAYVQLGKPGLAAEQLERVLKIHPNNGNEYAYLGHLYAADQQPAAAVQAFERAVALLPDRQDIKLFLENARKKVPVIGEQAQVG